MRVCVDKQCGAVLIDGQNSPLFTAPIGFGSQKTLLTTAPDTYGEALSRAAWCSEGRFDQWRVEDE